MRYKLLAVAVTTLLLTGCKDCSTQVTAPAPESSPKTVTYWKIMPIGNPALYCLEIDTSDRGGVWARQCDGFDPELRHLFSAPITYIPIEVAVPTNQTTQLPTLVELRGALNRNAPADSVAPPVTQPASDQALSGQPATSSPGSDININIQR